MKLDFQAEEFEDLLQQASRIVLNWYRELEERKVYHNYPAAEIAERFDEPLPVQGTEVAELLRLVEQDVAERSNLNIHPQYYAYITGGANQVAILAELLRTALNQNNLKWHSAPANSEMEKIVVRWVSEFIGYGVPGAGVLASGGAVANFLALAVARKQQAPFDVAEEGMAGGPRMCVYVSSEGHSSIDKAADMLGMGKKYVRKIPVKPDFTMDPQALVAHIEADRQQGLLPVCVVGIAGTTNTGAVDPLETLAGICRQYGLWYHIDAAYGGPAAATEAAGPLFTGIHLADSLIVNPHKWLYAPFEAACVLVRKGEHLRDTFSMIPPYLRYGQQDQRTDLMEYNLQLTKDFKALKIWMAFKAYGAHGLRKAISHDLHIARYLADCIRQTPDFELLAPVPLSIVCFRYLGPGGKIRDEQALNQLNERILQAVEADGRVFFTGTQLQGKTALRCCCINHRREERHIDELLNIIREIGLRFTNPPISGT
ncbi:MAG: aminotransferase class I/II-fold pyridoxal phosphate-dependent enzyme [Bacteroidetes bacterium]|nr:MAG: aminotransferase class I/II-fold pyridoxal phosphate-dependent enzyme [Bacteroidota bacterium]